MNNVEGLKWGNPWKHTNYTALALPSRNCFQCNMVHTKGLASETAPYKRSWDNSPHPIKKTLDPTYVKMHLV